MRTTFVQQLLELAKKNRDIVLVTGDLGYSVLESFQRDFPHQFINAGIAEQNMTGFAAGLALSNKIVFTYSIANFPTLRCLEQIRNDICYHQLNVKIISVGSGFSYGTQGYTHHGIEDLAVLRVLPNIKIFSPACPEEVKWSIIKMMEYQGPCYMRLAKQGEPKLHNSILNLNSSGVFPLISGYKNSIFATGSIVGGIFNWLQTFNIPLNLISIPLVNPISSDALKSYMSTGDFVITVEEHQLNAGFGSSILEVAHDLLVNGQINRLPRFFRIGVNNEIIPDMTSNKFLKMVIHQLKNIYMNEIN